jgi:hypothetical protein
MFDADPYADARHAKKKTADDFIAVIGNFTKLNSTHARSLLEPDIVDSIG